MSMPTEDDLRQLPLRAIVAYAARSARRAQSLDRGATHGPAINRAIQHAEGFARGDADVAWAGVAAADNASGARTAAAAWAANEAANAAWAADHVARGAASARAARAAAAAGHIASELAAQIGMADDWVLGAAYRDLQTLLALELGRFPDLGRPVDPGEAGPLGPLWPHTGPKPGGRNPSPAADAPDLVIAWDPAVLSPERYAELVALLGDLVRAEGGLGIERIRSLGLGVPSGAGVRR